MSLWLNNEEGSYHTLRGMAREAWENAEADATFTRQERAALASADSIKDWIEKTNPLTEASLFSDLLSAAISEVNWSEIAKSELEDVWTS